jgi:hypothetical protein
MPEVRVFCSTGVTVHNLTEEQRFFRKMYWICYSIEVVAWIAINFSLRSPTTVLDWCIYLAIFFCVGRLVAETVAVVGYRFWRKAFGHKYE